MKKPETKFGEKVDKYLRAKGGVWLNTHGHGMQESGWADRIGSYKGRFVAIELKVPGGKPTRLQLEFIKAVRKDGGFAEICESLDEVKNLISAVDNLPKV